MVHFRVLEQMIDLKVVENLDVDIYPEVGTDLGLGIDLEAGIDLEVYIDTGVGLEVCIDTGVDLEEHIIL